MAGKRSNGEGTMRLRSDGRWELTVMIGYKPDGKRNYKSFYGKKQKDVKEQVRQYKEDAAAGLKLDPKLTFSSWADTWFEGHKSSVSPTTQESYSYTLKTLKTAFGSKKLMDIKPVDVESFLKDLRADGKADSSLAKCRGMLYQIMNKAESNDLIRKNPVRFAEKMKSEKATKRKDAFTSDEVTLLMEKLPSDRMGNSIRIMLATGMRTQELLALEQEHIEADGSCIHIRQAVNMVKGTPHIGDPKSRDSIRDIPVPENVRWCASKLRETQNTFIWEVGVKDKPCNPTYFRKKFKEYVSLIPGVRVLTPHSCRHTFVSQMQALGIGMETIQSIVGHADTDMTQHYLHVQESVRLSAAEKFSKAFPTVPEKEKSEAAAKTA